MLASLSQISHTHGLVCHELRVTRQSGLGFGVGREFCHRGFANSDSPQQLWRIESDSAILAYPAFCFCCRPTIQTRRDQVTLEVFLDCQESGLSGQARPSPGLAEPGPGMVWPLGQSWYAGKHRVLEALSHGPWTISPLATKGWTCPWQRQQRQQQQQQQQQQQGP